MLRFAISVACIATPTIAAAATSDCIKVTPDLDRLACYDREAGRTPSATEISKQGKWYVTHERSKMTDQEDVFARLESDENVNCGWNKGAKIDLAIRCMDGKTSIYFVTGCHMTSSEYSRYGEIEYRIDNEKSQKVSGDASTDNRALGLWSGAKSIPLIKSIAGKSKLLVRMTPYSESSFTATFSIAGSDAVLKAVRQACKW